MSPQPKFWRRNCSTGLEWNSYIQFCPMFPLEPKFWSRYWYNCTLYSVHVHYSCTRAVQYLNERKMGMQFYVISLYWFWCNIPQKIVQYKFYNTLIAGRAGPGRKTNFAGRAGNFGPVDISTVHVGSHVLGSHWQRVHK